jgi:hypothetical protein
MNFNGVVGNILVVGMHLVGIVIEVDMFLVDIVLVVDKLELVVGKRILVVLMLDKLVLVRDKLMGRLIVDMLKLVVDRRILVELHMCLQVDIMGQHNLVGIKLALPFLVHSLQQHVLHVDGIWSLFYK